MQEPTRPGNQRNKLTASAPRSTSTPLRNENNVSVPDQSRTKIDETVPAESVDSPPTRLTPRPRARYSQEHRVLLELLIEARKASGLSQKALSKRLSKSLSHISFVESNDRDLTFVEVARICAITGLPLTELAQRFEALVQKSGGYALGDSSQVDGTSK